MAVLSDYVTGTITLTSGSTTFTGTGTAWRLANIREGDTILVDNLVAVIAANSPTDPLIDSNTTGKLTRAWTGTTATRTYRIRFLSDVTRVNAETRTLIELLGNGNLTAMSGLSGTADTLPYFNGIGTMALTNLTSVGRQIIASTALTAVQSAIGIPEQLTTDRNWYVRPDGNDANTGLANTAGAAFKTIVAAMNAVYSRVDARNWRQIINVADSTYTDNLSASGSPKSSGNTFGYRFPLYIVGNVATPNNCVIAGNSNCLAALGGARLDIRGFKMAPTVGNSYCIYTEGNGTEVNFGPMIFGQVNYDHVTSTGGSVVTFDSPYTIIGGALNHMHATEGGTIKYIGPGAATVTLSGTPAFTGQFLGVASSVVHLNNITYSGAATGRKFLIHYNGTVRTLNSNQNTFPGSVRGIEDGGGRLDYASRFHVTKGGSNQSILNNTTEQQITFGTIVENLGDGGWNAAGPWFNPRSGTCAMSVAINFNAGFAAANLMQLSIYKNSVNYKTAISYTGSAGPHSLNIALAMEKCTGDDVYQVYARVDGTGSVTVNGSPSTTYFMGTQH